VRSGDGIGARFLRGSFTSILVNVVGAGVAFGVQIVLARAMGAHSYGEYLYALSWMNWAALLARFQLDNCAPRFVSEYRATGQGGLLRAFVNFSHLFAARNALLMAAAGVAFVLLTNLVPPHFVPIALAALVLLAPSTLLELTKACLEGLQQMLVSQSTNLVVRPALLGAMALMVWLVLKKPLGPSEALWLNVVATSIALLLAWTFLRRGMNSAGAHKADPPAKSAWMHTAVGFWWVAVAQQVLTTQTDVLVVGSLLSKEKSGIYGAASQLATLVGFGANAVSAMGAPLIAQLHAQNRHDDLQALVRHYGRLNLAVSVPAFLIVAVWGVRALTVYGEEFGAAYPVLLILSLTQMVRGVIGVQAGYMLTMTGRERIAGKFVGISALINVVLTLVLTPTIGVVGTAIATLIGTVTRSALLERYIYKEFGIDISGFLLPRRR
jgi:O-antigen/teichoic acid export membrane protein